MGAVKERKRSGGVTLNAGELKRCLQVVSGAVAARGKPALSSVLLADGLLTATNLEVRIETAIDYHGEAMLLPHGRMLAILNATSGDEVTLTASGSSCVVRCGRGEWTLPLEDAAEFPTWEPAGLKPVVRVPADEFARAVHSVLPATDNESSRYALGAVLLEVDAENATLVATDGRRLHKAEVGYEQSVDPSQSLLPKHVAATIASLARTDDSSVQLEGNAEIIRAEVGGTTVTAKQVAGRFPRWRDVLKDGYPKPSHVEQTALLAATRAAAIVTSEQSRGVTYAFTPDGLHLTAQSSESGQASVTCDVESCGHACTVLLDPEFVIEWLKALPSGTDPTITVQAKDKASAVVLTSDRYTAVIMPLDPSA